jgi:hypothetical protein
VSVQRFAAKSQKRRRGNKAFAATNKAEPMIDQTIGNLVPTMRIKNISGRRKAFANHLLIIALTKLRAIEVNQPPCAKPARLLPIPPTTAAMMSKTM